MACSLVIILEKQYKDYKKGVKMIYVTGDCHADWKKFSKKSFPEQKDMTRNDFVIVCGDFGICHNDSTEKWWFKWFEEKNFTVLFVDGNHENFDRLYSDEFEIVDFHGGKAHKICENVYHLMRGYVYELCGKKFFAFGGASSHDIQDGILDPLDYKTFKDLADDYNRRTNCGEMLRINHISWWKEEMPTQEEMDFGLETLKANGYKVDYSGNVTEERDLLKGTGASTTGNIYGIYDMRICGRYHRNDRLLDKYYILYGDFMRIE